MNCEATNNFSSQNRSLLEIFESEYRHPLVTNEHNHCSTYALYISPSFNSNVFSHDTLRIYTTIYTLYIDILKISFRHVKRYREISQVLDTPPCPYIVTRISIAYERLMSSGFGTKYYCPVAISSSFKNFEISIFPLLTASSSIYMNHFG
jgi:hypothetical protein